MARPLTLQRALSLRFALISGIFFAAIAASIFLWVKPRLENRVIADNLILATALSAQVERFLDSPAKILEEAAKTLAKDETHDKTLRKPLLETMVNGVAVFQALYLVNPQGRLDYVVFDRWSRPDASDFRHLDLSANPVFIKARSANATVWSDVFMSAVSRAPAVAVSTRSGNSILIGEIGLDYLSNFVRQTESGEGGIALIVDRNGQVLAHPDAVVAKQMVNISNFSQLGKIGDKDHISGRASLEGREMIASLIRVNRLNWFVLVAKPYEIAVAAVTETVTALVIAGIVTIVLAVWLNEIMSRTLAQRFEHLARSASRLASGDYGDIKWPETPLIELNAVAAALRAMTAAIVEREHALRDINQTLEERVQLRTAELEKANAKLNDSIKLLQFAQDDLVRAEKLAALGALVAGVAHELNTPIGNAVTIASTLRDKSNEFAHACADGNLRRSVLDEYTNTIMQGSELVMRNLFQAADLVANFKQVAVDQTSAQRRRFDLKEVIEEVLSTLHHLVRNKPVKVTTLLAAGIEMDSYPGPLGQVINPLFNNALIHGFAGRNGGEVVIEARADGDAGVTIEIRDDGNGISADNLGRVFDPFFTTRLGQGGSGLGLNIVHNIITQLLGGRISVDSPARKGTRFRIELPRIAIAPAAATPATARESAANVS